MNTTTTATTHPQDYGYNVNNNSRSLSPSAVSWGAIVAGAAGAAALSLILLILGMGLGLSSVSPWANEGISAESFGMSTIIWLTVTQLLSSALGGYLAGRLRTKWVDVHNDEIYFRDTAHGFLAWAVASLVTAVLLTSVIGSILSGGASMVSNVSNTATMAAMAANESQGTGISQQDMEQRVSEIYTRVQNEIQGSEESRKEATEAAREASAYAALWIFVALLIGAFAASLSATFGGKQRDAINTDHSTL
ncbi:hypothetical protein [Limnobacter parvus]|uniref:PhnA-like protein n=1 Tax=Limnobacter parvus TaxID=2939690 RepID=A0ABT1XP22_9BURK|nr:hypothetical protein [Limnobacter parvus]MCR2747844.1 hypothetical protein [Limnobacter parvus]